MMVGFRNRFEFLFPVKIPCNWLWSRNGLPVFLVVIMIIMKDDPGCPWSRGGGGGGGRGGGRGGGGGGSGGAPLSVDG